LLRAKPIMSRIAIVGGGPAGSMCGEQLARAGYSVHIFDEHLAWEKPCGGGLTHKALEAFPFLVSDPRPKKFVRSIELISSRGQRFLLQMENPILIYSRSDLNALLLERAASAGCEVIRSHVSAVETPDSGARLMAGSEWLDFDFLVVAAGARNRLLLGSRPLEPRDLEMTLGYFVPSRAEAIKVKFLPNFEGYIWLFPRSDHLSVGICGSMAAHTSQQLRDHLHAFMREEGVDPTAGRFYSHVLPSPQARTLSERPVVGKHWALVGDAAALVDPLTGEGLYYAMRSGELLGKSLAEGRPESYPERVRAAFSADLEFAARSFQRFYRGTFLGGAVTTRMIQFMRRSATFRQLMADLFSGAQSYRGLKARLWSQFGVTLNEILASLLRLERT
jgi:flavin-dependent dehydrogenase